MTAKPTGDEVYGLGRRPAQKCKRCGREENLAQPFMDGVCVECLRNAATANPPPMPPPPPMPRRPTSSGNSSAAWAVLVLIGFGCCGVCVLTGIITSIIGLENKTPTSSAMVAPTPQRTPKPATVTSPPAKAEARWYTGGTLHKATMKEWREATDANRLATAGDYVSKLLLEEGVSIATHDDIEQKVRPLAEDLLRQLEAANPDGSFDEKSVSEAVALIWVLKKKGLGR